MFIDKIEGYLKSKKKENFIDNLVRFLIKRYNLAAKEVRKKARQVKDQYIPCIANHTLMKEDEILDRPISKTI